jgi:NADH-quinone oxidoreductase subunit N
MGIILDFLISRETFLIYSWILSISFLWIKFIAVPKELEKFNFRLNDNIQIYYSYYLLGFFLIIIVTTNVECYSLNWENGLKILQEQHISFSTFFHNYIENDITLFFKSFIIILSCIIFISLMDFFKNEKIYNNIEYFLILTLSIISMLILISSKDLILIYLVLEMQSLALYVLASSKQNSIISIESGLKYFLMGSISSGFFLMGSAFIYGYVGSTNLIDILFFITYITHPFFFYLLFFSILFLFIPFFFKFSVVPFHMWTPDVYEGAPTFVTFFFSLVPKFTSFILILYLSFDVFYIINQDMRNIFFLLSFFSLILGSIGGLLQQKIKRLLAYSSIANVGFFLIAFCATFVEGISAVLFYFFIYSFLSIALFFIILNIRYLNNSLKFKNIYEYSSLINSNIPVSLVIISLLFSFIGIPPLAGFFGKFFLLFSIAFSEYFVLFICAVIASVLTAFYYLRFLRIILFKRFNGFVALNPISNVSSIIISCIFFFNLLLFLDISFFFNILDNLSYMFLYEIESDFFF